jgi:hypothetical protein
MKTLNDVLNKRYVGQFFNWHNQLAELIINDFNGKLALDNEQGQIFIEDIEIDETCPFCNGNGFSYMDLCLCLREKKLL